MNIRGDPENSVMAGLLVSFSVREDNEKVAVIVTGASTLGLAGLSNGTVFSDIIGLASVALA